MFRVEHPMTIDDVLEQALWDFFWIPTDCHFVDRPELLYGVCPRDNPSINVVTRIRSEDPAPLLDEVVAAHAGRTSRVHVNPGNDSPKLRQALTDRGYLCGPQFFAFSKPVDAIPTIKSTVEVRSVQTLEDLRLWFDACAAGFGSRIERAPHEDAYDLARCTGPDARTHRVVALLDGAPVGAGGMSTHPRLKFAFLWAGAVAPEARGRGIYSAILAARAEHARTLGITDVGLYAKHDTSAPIVRAKGFEQAGPMVYFERPPTAGA